MRIYTRAELSSRPFARPRQRVPIQSRDWVIYHYPGLGTPPRELEAYRRWMERIHMDQNGWATVGYNYFIAANGDVGEGCGRDVVGSHSPPHNRDGIGVNIWTSNGVATPESLHSAVLLHEQLEREAGHSLRAGWHGMDYPTACPGPQIRGWVRSGMPDPLADMKPSNPAPAPKPSLTLLEDIMSTPAERKEFARELAQAIWAHQTTEYYDEDGKGPSERSMTHVVNRMHQWLGEMARGSLITDRVDAAFWRPMWPDHDGELGSSIRNNLGLMSARMAHLAENAGIDVDETELGKAVATELAATVRAAVLEAGAPEEVATRAADILAGRLTTPTEGEA